MSADSQFREKVRQAIQAVAEVFGDTTVAVSTTREGLEEIAEEVMLRITLLKEGEEK